MREKERIKAFPYFHPNFVLLFALLFYPLILSFILYPLISYSYGWMERAEKGMERKEGGYEVSEVHYSMFP